MLLLILSLTAILGAGCWRPSEERAAPINVPAEPAAPNTAGATPSTIPSLAGTTTGALATGEPQIGEIASASGNVIISSLVREQLLPNPFVILGRVRGFENTVNWRVRDQNGSLLASGVATAAGEASNWNPFRVRAFLKKAPSVAQGSVEVYTLSPRDGAEQDALSIPIKLVRELSPLKVYFSNILKDPQSKACDLTYPVIRRVPKTVNLAEAALLELLEGPTAAEQVFGSRTAIIPGSALRSVNISEDVATVDFSRAFAFGISRACEVQMLRSQVESTLKQFPNVKVVKIRVEGADADQYLNPKP